MVNVSDEQRQIVRAVRDFVVKEVMPVAHEMEKRDEYPHHLVEMMKDLGLFGVIIPEEYGGLGLPVSTYAMIVEEICRGWMSLTGILNSHTMLAYTIWKFGTEKQRRDYLPDLCAGRKRGGLALTEPNAGTDVQAIRTTAVRDGDVYLVNGNKMFITNGLHGSVFALAAKTDTQVKPAYKGISLFIAEKGHPGFQVGNYIEKLGYKGLDTVELNFDNYQIPADLLLGGEPGHGFKQVMGGLEIGRINVAARAVGVSQAAFEDSIKYAQQRATMGKPIAEHQAIQLKLADMATKIEASRLLVRQAAEMADRGERCDLQAGMAKLFATETCAEVSMEAMRIHGGYGYTKEMNVERYYRDAPLMIIGEGTNEIQRIVIARQLLKEYPV